MSLACKSSFVLHILTKLKAREYGMFENMWLYYISLAAYFDQDQACKNLKVRENLQICLILYLKKINNISYLYLPLSKLLLASSYIQPLKHNFFC